MATVWTHYKGRNTGKSKTDGVYVVYIIIGKMNELDQPWFNVAVSGTSGKLEQIRFMIDCPLNIRRQSNVAVINTCQSLIKRRQRVFVILKTSSFVLYHHHSGSDQASTSNQSQWKTNKQTKIHQ